MIARLHPIHRWIGLVFLLFWLVQAASGLFLVFHREIDDFTVDAAFERPLNPVVLGQRIRALETRRDSKATSIFSSTGFSNRYDVALEDNATGSVSIVRVDGEGNILRERAFDVPVLKGGFYLVANRIHRNLLSGPAGAWIVAISGILLLSNLLIGLRLAWPKHGQWRRALWPPRATSARARFYGWHRALGLWVAPFALVTIGCGMLLAFEVSVARLLGAEGNMPPPRQQAAEGVAIAPMEAAKIALRRYPDASFTGMQIPATGSGLYVVYLRQRQEPNQADGATRVFVDARNGRVASEYDPLRASGADRFMTILFPIHTGQIAGKIGRLAVLAIGLWLISMLLLGSRLWWARRRRWSKPARPERLKRRMVCTVEQ